MPNFVIHATKITGPRHRVRNGPNSSHGVHMAGLGSVHRSSANRRKQVLGMADSPTPVVFIHGLWLHASSWQPWVDLFRENGYDPIAPGWPGDELTVEATRANTDAVSDHGIEEVTDHFASIIDALPTKPIVIGHSFGG